MAPEEDLKKLRAAVSSARRLLGLDGDVAAEAGEAGRVRHDAVDPLPAPGVPSVVLETMRHLEARADGVQASLDERTREMGRWMARLIGWETTAQALEQALARLSTAGMRADEEARLEGKRDALLERFLFACEEQAGGDRAGAVAAFGRLVGRIGALDAVAPENRARLRILDVDCHRGEWLEAMHAAGFVEATGIDPNEEMVIECRRRSLAALRQDAVRGLASLPDASLEAVSAMRMGRQATLGTFLLFANEARRVLVPGGHLLVGDVPRDEDAPAPVLPAAAGGQALSRDTLLFAVQFLGFRDPAVISGGGEDASAATAAADTVVARKP